MYAFLLILVFVLGSIAGYLVSTLISALRYPEEYNYNDSSEDVEEKDDEWQFQKYFRD